MDLEELKGAPHLTCPFAHIQQDAGEGEERIPWPQKLSE